MLQALVELAESERLVGDPTYEMKPVAWIIRLSPDGKLLRIVGTHFTPFEENFSKRKRKPKEEVRKLLVPRQSGRAGRKAPAYFFVDNAKYVWGHATADKPFTEDEGREKSTWFLEQIKACFDATQDAAVGAVLSFLQSVARNGLPEALPEKCKSNDQFAFQVEPDFESFVHRSPAVIQYWHDINAAATNSETKYQCLATGQPMAHPGLFPLTKRVPGGQPGGSAVVSFNKSAFESYGWKNNENAAISESAALHAGTALNRLFDPAFVQPETGEVLGKRNYRLAEDTVVCYWSSSVAGQELCDAFGFVLDAAESEEVGEMYRSLWKGHPPTNLDTSSFYAVTLSGAQGRVIVRDWFETTVGIAQQYLATHFTDLAIGLNTYAAKGKTMPVAIPLRILLESLAPLGKADQIPPALAGQIIRAAINGGCYPRSILSRAIQRMRAEVTKDGWIDSYRRDGRAALLKATLNRLKRRQPETYSFPEVLPCMDPNNHNPGYLLGRLMAALERMQFLALGGEVNATIVDKFFGTASATPAAVFPSLLRRSTQHFRRAKKHDDWRVGTAINLDREMSNIMESLTAFPRYLPVVEQGLFMLGYHHQRHEFGKPKDKEASN